MYSRWRRSSKPPTRRTTHPHDLLLERSASKPPTRRTTQPVDCCCVRNSSKPPTRRTTQAHGAHRRRDTSKPPTRRTTFVGKDIARSLASKPPTRRTTSFRNSPSISQTSKPPTRRTTRAIRDNIFIFQRITSWHPPIASFASPLFNYFIPKGFSEQLFLKPKGSYKKDEMLFPVSYCSHLYKPIPFLLCTSSSFPLVRNGPSAAAAPYWTATPCAQGNVAGCRP